jgi:hypothetical protein
MDWLKILIIKMLLTVPALFIGLVNLLMFICKGIVAFFMPLLHLWTDYKNVVDNPEEV